MKIGAIGSLTLTASLLAATSSAQVHTVDYAWPPIDSELMQVSPSSGSGDGTTVSQLRMGRWRGIAVAVKRNAITPIDVSGELTGHVSFADGSVRELRGLFTGTFTATYEGSADGADTYGLEADVIEYKDGDDRVMRTRPGNHKPGKLMMTKDVQGGWTVNSFFDVFLDLSLDGGKTFQSLNDPIEFGIQSAPVPEPGTLAALGLGMLASWRRRKRS